MHAIQCDCAYCTGFIPHYLTELLNRYKITYKSEGLYAEYFITDLRENRVISSDLVLSLNTFSKEIHVTRFYPELYKEPATKYLSAACFYLLVHHFAGLMDIHQNYRIFLETRTDIFHDFYEKLQDFNMVIRKPGLGSNQVDVSCRYCPMTPQITLTSCREETTVMV